MTFGLDRIDRTVRADGRHLPAGFLDCERPVAHIVADFVWGKITTCQPTAGLESNDLEPGLGQWERSSAPSGAESYDDDIGGG